MCKKLNKLEFKDDFKIVQIREKFGQLQVYAIGVDKERCEIIHNTETKSRNICESCGTKINVKIIKTSENYYYTICDNC